MLRHYLFTFIIESKPKVTVDEGGSAHIHAEILLTQKHKHEDIEEEIECEPQERKTSIIKGVYFSIHIREVIMHALQCLERESDYWAELSRLDWDDKKQFGMFHPPKHLVGKVNKLTGMLRKGMMRRLCLHPKPGGSSARHDLRNLLEYYQVTLPTVQGAKDRYKKNADSPKWMQIVSVDYPEMQQELIARLSGREKDLTKEHSQLLGEKGGTSKPSDIALEWAARLCGVPRYHYALSHLQREKGKQAKNKG